MAFDPVRADPELLDIDARLVEPETRYEMYDGELVYVPPADGPHGERHAQLAALIETSTGLECKVAVDMLTRTSKVDDIAPDVSVYPAARDPVTGRRQLMQLAFEIVGTQSLARAGVKAAKLTRRGVRRVFAIDVERSRMLEWSTALDTWSPLDPSGYIEDPALKVPLPIKDMLRDAKADDAVARALLAKRNPVLMRNRAEGRARGKAEGLAKGLAKGKAEGLAKGKAEGLAKGKAEGLAKGLAKGKAEGLAKGKAEGLAKGKAEGLAKGKAEGLAKGRAEGLAEGKARAVIAVLAARGIGLDDDTRERILGERDESRLERWVVRALRCATVGELLADR